MMGIQRKNTQHYKFKKNFKNTIMNKYSNKNSNERHEERSEDHQHESTKQATTMFPQRIMNTIQAQSTEQTEQNQIVQICESPI